MTSKPVRIVMYVLGAAAFAAGLLVAAVGGSFVRLFLASRRREHREPIGSRHSALVRSAAFAALGFACILVAVFAYMPTFGLRILGLVVGVVAIFLSIRTYEIDSRGQG
jgi:energy-converting hydrogenase Eha subunit A